VTSQVFLTAFAMFCSVPVIMLGMVVISKHLSRRQASADLTQNEDVMRRLERIEQAVEASAIEIERFAESNRFIVKLLSERSQPNQPDDTPATQLPYPSRSG
jgi:hypothetical protein